MIILSILYFPFFIAISNQNNNAANRTVAPPTTLSECENEIEFKRHSLGDLS